MKPFLPLALLAIAVPLSSAPATAKPAGTVAAVQDGDRDDRRWRDDDRRERRWRDADRRDDRADDRRWRGDDDDWEPSESYREGRYRDRRLSRNDRIYKGRDGRAYCQRGDGTTGLVVGGVGGGVLGNLIGGGTLGTLLGAGGGALLGRQIDRGNVKCR